MFRCPSSPFRLVEVRLDHLDYLDYLDYQTNTLELLDVRNSFSEGKTPDLKVV